VEYANANIPVKPRILEICKSLANVVFRRKRDLKRLFEEIESLRRKSVARFDSVEKDIHEARREIRRLRNDTRNAQNAIRRVEDSIAEARVENLSLRTDLPKEVQKRFESISEQQFIHRARSMLDRMENLLKALEFKTPTKLDLAKIKVLRDLLRDGYVGGKHTSVEHAVGSLATDERSYGKEAIKVLIRDGVLLDKNTHYGRQISIHPKKTLDVKTFLRYWGLGVA
jgi:septation ring formation regulator EzrA